MDGAGRENDRQPEEAGQTADGGFMNIPEGIEEELPFS